MKDHLVNRFGPACVAWLFCALLTLPCSAADSIIIGNSKPSIDPSQPRPQARETPGLLNRSPNASPFDTGPWVLPQPRSVDPDRARKLRNARDERENWMFLDPGELQEAERERERELGGGRYREDNVGTGGKRGYLFYKSDTTREGRGDTASKRSPGRSGQLNRNSGRDGQDEEAYERAEMTLDDEDETRSQKARRENRESGETSFHTTEALSLKDFLQADQPDNPAVDQKAFSLGDLLRRAETERAREQQTRLTEFKQMLTAPRGEGETLSAPPNAPGFARSPATQPDFTAAPALAAPIDIGPSAPRNDFLSTPAQSLSISRPSLPTLSGFNELPSRGLSRDEPGDFRQREPVMVQPQPTVLDLPKRGGLIGR